MSEQEYAVGSEIYRTLGELVFLRQKVKRLEAENNRLNGQGQQISVTDAPLSERQVDQSKALSSEHEAMFNMG